MGTIRFRRPLSDLSSVETPLPEPLEEEEKSEQASGRLAQFTSDFRSRGPWETLWAQFRLSVAARKRMRQITSQAMLQTHLYTQLGVSVALVLGIGAYEASLLTRDPILHWSFVFEYSITNLFPSFVWETVDAELVALSMGLDPKQVLANLDPEISVEVAQRASRVESMSYGRALVGGFETMTLILRMTNLSQKAKEIYRNRLLQGKEAFFNVPEGERVVRLCGRESYTTHVAIQRYKRHIVPVFEDPEVRSVRKICKKLWWSGMLPSYLCVRAGDYGDQFAWDKFAPQNDWALVSRSGKKIFLVEADAINGDDALSLGKPATDLTFQKASLCFHSIEKALTGRNVCYDRFVKVCLVDSTSKLMSGGGNEYSLRKYIDTSKEADIVIDATAPILLEAQKWMFDACSRGSSKKVVLHTDDLKAFVILSKLMSSFGYIAIDWRDAQDAQDLPRLIYQVDTSLTVNTVETMLKNKACDPSKTCALIEKAYGIQTIEDICDKYESIPIVTICSATIHDDLFRQVRVWLRLDFSTEQIQGALDRRYSSVLYHASSLHDQRDASNRQSKSKAVFGI